MGQVVRFGISGGITNVTNYATFFVLLRLLGDAAYTGCSIAGFFAGFVVGFVLNRGWVFGVARPGVHRQMVKFLGVNLVSLGALVGTIRLCVEALGIIPEIGQILAILVSAAINFSGYKWWVFASDRADAARQAG
jgi:putative flippase GtrA